MSNPAQRAVGAGQSYQERVRQHFLYVERVRQHFLYVAGDDTTDMPERRDRACEEFAELQQALGGTLEGWIAVGRYVWGRPIGEPAQEMGGTLNTLAALAAWADLDMMACAEAELERTKRPEIVAKIRRKRANRHGRGVLPGNDADLVTTALASPRADSDERTAGGETQPAALYLAVGQAIVDTVLPGREADFVSSVPSIRAVAEAAVTAVRRSATPAQPAEPNLGTLAVPDGWMLVPVEATGAMWAAGQEADQHPGDSYGAVWRAMVEAGPAAPVLLTPAQPAGAVPDSLRALSEAASALLSACMADMGPLDDMDRDDEPVGMSGFGVGTAVTFGHIRRMERALASHPAGQSAGSGETIAVQKRDLIKMVDAAFAVDPSVPTEAQSDSLFAAATKLASYLPLGLECTGCGSRESIEVIQARGFSSCCPERKMQPAPDSTRTGQREALRSAMIRALDGHTAHSRDCHMSGDYLCQQVWPLVEAALAARPAAPEAQGAWRPIAEAPADGQAVLAWGEEWGGPKQVPADGGWWNLPASMRPSVLPTHWMPLPAPPSAGQGGR